MGDGTGTFTVLAFGAVESLLESWAWTSENTTFTIVDAFLGVGVVFDVELSVGVPCKRFGVAAAR